MSDNDDKKNPPQVDTKRRLSRRNLLRRLGGQHEDRPGKAAMGIDNLGREADSMIREQQYEKALAVYERMTERDPRHREAWRYRGWCLIKLNRPAEARDALQTLLKSHPDDGHALLYTGMTHAMQDDVELALDVWRRYRDYTKVLIMREINLMLYEADQDESLQGKDLIRWIEDAIRRQEQG
ncbi:MAG: tetratricopeptide repeat protein [Xanthomonadaceae bacterium]|nr:tetratricopeptide repeat protein [Xanthomonadaceae bacterium]